MAISLACLRVGVALVFVRDLNVAATDDRRLRIVERLLSEGGGPAAGLAAIGSQELYHLVI
jgi:hypothetical protein